MILKKLIPAMVLMLSGIAAASVTNECNYVSKPVAYMVSDAHLDTQWNWDVQTTIRDYVWNTINRNLVLLNEYPDYIFNFEGGIKYAWIKEYYPREYDLLKQKIAEGRWHVCGSSWDANDVNVPSIESLIRNILLGQNFYRDEFGVESTDIFLPDCFGFGWTLPTVASHCGLIGFSSQKLAWRNNPFYGDKKLPFTIGLWQGVDGARIMMAHGYDYTTKYGNEDLTQKAQLSEQIKESQLNTVYHYYGVGDVGGAPTAQSVDAVTKAVKKDGNIKVISATSDQLYKDYLPYESHPDLPVFDGELTMDVHGTGCYTSQAAMKKYNRQNELLASAAEGVSVVAELIAGVPYPTDELTDAWKRFIYHQFHDDLTGTSIPKAYEYSWNDELLTQKQFADILTSSASHVASKLDTRVDGIPVVLYNPLGHPVTDIVEMTLHSSAQPKKVTVKDGYGKQLISQITYFNDGQVKILAQVSLPANGYSTIGVKFDGKGSDSIIKPVNSIENVIYKVEFDGNGDIKSLLDKRQNKELVSPGKTIRLALFEENKSYAWPAWEILKTTIDASPISIIDNVTINMVEDGPLRKTVHIEKEYGDSKFHQYIRLYEGELAERIDFYNEIDWATTNALLKAEFPLSITNPDATYDLGIGSIKRGNNTETAYEVYAHRWADLTDADDSYGVTIMNDCKYGWDKPNDNTLRLTLIHTPQTSSWFEYQGCQDFGHHTFTYSLLPHIGSLDKVKASACADNLNQGIKAFSTLSHSGSLGKTFSFAASDNPAIEIKAIKKAESGNEYVVRLYETSGVNSQNGTINFPFEIKDAVIADGTEKTLAPADFEGKQLRAHVNKNGIATYKITFNVSEENPATRYATLSLNYNKNCFSLNSLGNESDFSNGFSYAKEIIPDTIHSSGIPFVTSKNEIFNGLICNGDTLCLPEGKYDKLYILAAAAKEQDFADGEFKVGNSVNRFTIPSYTGFIGQWGHTCHTVGFLLDDKVGYIGTHRHSAEGDCPYEYTYMFRYAIDLPENTRQIILPDNPDIVIFAATLAAGTLPPANSSSRLFQTSIIEGDTNASYTPKSILSADKIIRCSGYVNDQERPQFMHDGDMSTKWCDYSGITSYVDYDLGSSTSIKGWSISGAGVENPDYITSSCLLQVRNNADEEWMTVDAISSNKMNIVTRKLKTPVDARYLRLMVVQPEQNSNSHTTRIYEFIVF